jgi:hypothetical protein
MFPLHHARDKFTTDQMPKRNAKMKAVLFVSKNLHTFGHVVKRNRFDAVSQSG